MTLAEAASAQGQPRSYELTISLVGAGVDIDRRVLAPEHYTLADLHLVIQAAMGWAGYHLHEFTARDGAAYGDAELDDPDVVDETSVLLGEVLREPGDALRYVYDLGDYWEHHVELAAIRAPQPGAAPSCIGGRGACPPEDCGGVGGYEELRAVLADPDAPEHEELAEWTAEMLGRPVSDPIDVHAFDLNAADEAVRATAASAHGGGPATT